MFELNPMIGIIEDSEKEGFILQQIKGEPIMLL
jgi:hypothetical protein